MNPPIARYTEDKMIVSIWEQYLDEVILPNPDIDEEIRISNPKKTAFQFLSDINVYYHIDDRRYVDINHIISKLVSTEHQYSMFYKNFGHAIRHSIWTNRFDGNVIKRNLIDIATMGRIILSFNSPYRKRFIIECKLYIALILILFGYMKIIMNFYLAFHV